MLLQVATWSRHEAKINSLFLFGDHILSVDVEGNLFIWAFKGADRDVAPIGHIMLDDNFTPSCIMHPDTYLNKVSSSFVVVLFIFFSILLFYPHHEQTLVMNEKLQTDYYWESGRFSTALEHQHEEETL